MEKEIDQSIDYKSVYKGQPLSEEQAMQMAIQVAYLGASYVAPNPLVGCVVLDSQGKFLSYGYHEKYGGPHAEINALRDLTLDELNQAQVYVTLEPCAHQGKTGSCAKKMSELPLKRVIFGLIDPNPLVAGQGATILNQSGIEAREYQGPLKLQLEEVAEVFLKNFRFQKVFVAAKVASSLDGQIAMKNGQSKWITGAESRQYVHELRSYYDALLIGKKTIEIDNPSLNIRHPHIQKENKIIIMDPEGELILKVHQGHQYNFLDTHARENIFFACSRKVDLGLTDSLNQQVLYFDHLSHLLNQCWTVGIRSLFIEGGAYTYSTFLENNLIDRLHIFINASVIGTLHGVSWTNHFGVESLDQKKELKNIKTRIFGSDVYVTGRF